jgi:hypothetical protein
MSMPRAHVPYAVSELLGHRPVRWAAPLGDYDGRERTLEVFFVEASEQEGLLEQIWDRMPELETAAGGPIVVVFHGRAESMRRDAYRAFVDAWEREPRPLALRAALGG